MTKKEIIEGMHYMWMTTDYFKRHCTRKPEPDCHNMRKTDIMREAYCNQASEDFFTARKRLDTTVHRRLFEAGFNRACDIQSGLVPDKIFPDPVEKQTAPDWKGWRDVEIHGYPEDKSVCFFCLNGKVFNGAYMLGMFWSGGKKYHAALWMPKPEAITPEEHQALIASHDGE